MSPIQPVRSKCRKVPRVRAEPRLLAVHIVVFVVDGPCLVARRNRLGRDRLCEVFAQTALGLSLDLLNPVSTMYAMMCSVTDLASQCPRDLQRRTDKAQLDHDIAMTSQHLSFNCEATTYPVAAATTRNAKYKGLNNTTIASFHPRKISKPYIQYGICATLDTVLRFAST